MSARLQTLVIENFRSLRGTVAIPLDAQVVLIHGTNGMGKTSVLSALELALTGSIAHLARSGDGYKGFITNLNKQSGSIKLTTTTPFAEGARSGGAVDFSNTTFESAPLLDDRDATFFAERCYLPQSTLGRLLEIYDERDTNSSSPLTQFVKEILRIDPLDALADGLKPAFHVTRIRNLVPEYRRLEVLNTALDAETTENDEAIAAAELSISIAVSKATEQLTNLKYPSVALATKEQVEAAKRDLADRNAESDALATSEKLRAEIRAATASWRSLSPDAATRDQAAKDQQSQSATDQLNSWRDNGGQKIGEILGRMGSDFPDLPSLDDGPIAAIAAARNRAMAEAERCNKLIAQANAASAAVATIRLRTQRANARIGEIDRSLSKSAGNAQAFATALAGIASHLHGDNCPVCDRNYSEVDAGPLSVHIANKIGQLTTEAGRLQALSTERANQSGIVASSERELLSAEQLTLEPGPLADLSNRAGRVNGFAQELVPLVVEAENGARLMAQASAAREASLAARRQTELTTTLLPDIERLVVQSTGTPVHTFAGVDAALEAAARGADEQSRLAQAMVNIRVETISVLGELAGQITGLDQLRTRGKELAVRVTEVEVAVDAAKECRNLTKRVSEAAQTVRSATVKQVFNNNLNKVWRDLFVRLAPSEDFVPMFKLPTDDHEKVEAILETYHRTEGRSGSPGAMLSQGNLNTAALTLFLALHLSVPAKLPWLVLDDPVQSMDDVHIAQFAALLRSLSKSMGRQLIVAIHERALFDYLTLELSPAFPGDSLMTVEVTRNFDGETVAKSTPYFFEDDRVIAA